MRGRDLAGAVAEAQEKTADLFKAPYRAEWSGEFQEMLEAEHRLMYIIPLSLAAIFVLLYLAFHDLVDALLVFSNVVALSVGGVWALLLTGTNFSISAAVGFISIFGVAIMDGLLLVSYFNHLRAEGLPLREAIMQGAEKRVRPVMMTALTAIFGLLPAALSTRIGSQTQRPLAIVVVGGMVTTLFLTRYLMPVLVQLLRPPRAALRRRQPGALTYPTTSPERQRRVETNRRWRSGLVEKMCRNRQWLGTPLRGAYTANRRRVPPSPASPGCSSVSSEWVTPTARRGLS